MDQIPPEYGKFSLNLMANFQFKVWISEKLDLDPFVFYLLHNVQLNDHKGHFSKLKFHALKAKLIPFVYRNVTNFTQIFNFFQFWN